MSTPKTDKKSTGTTKSRNKKKTVEENKKPNSRVSLNHSSDSTATTQVSSTPSTPTGDVLRDSLKIKIKLSPNVTAPPIYLFPTDQLADVKTSLQPFFHKSGDYSEEDLKQLQAQLETSKAVVSSLARAFSQQIDALESWRTSLQGAIPSQLTELRPWRDNTFDRDDDDVEVDVEGEGDVDVVAMDMDESADGSTRADDYYPDNSFAKSRASSDHQTKMAQLIRRRTQPGGSRHKKITKAATLPAVAGTPDHRKRRGDSETKDLKRKADTDLADVPEDAFLHSDEEEKIIRHAPLGPNSFWVAMDAYFRPVTDADLAFLTPKADRPDDPAYQIPPLGTHYHQSWATEDAELGEKRANRPNARVAKTEDGSEAEEDEVYVGDLTQRLLASLLEEQAVVGSQPPSPGGEEDSKDLAITPTIPIHNYSQAYMASLEERIRLELCSIGLMDATEEVEGSDKDDDELCGELRQLQNQLREQTIANNERKLKLLALVKVKMVEQEQQRKHKAANVVIEKQYENFIKKKKKRKGSRPLNVQDTPLGPSVP